MDIWNSWIRSERYYDLKCVKKKLPDYVSTEKGFIPPDTARIITKSAIYEAIIQK